MITPLIAGLGTPEILIIVVVLVLLFGAKKLPELARGSGQALRIFKAETKGLIDDDDKDSKKTEAQKEIDQRVDTRTEAEREIDRRVEEKFASEKLKRERRAEPGA